MGIDPATRKTGICVLEADGHGSVRLEYLGTVHVKGHVHIDARMWAMGERCAALVSLHAPDLVIVEDIMFTRYAKYIRSLVKTAAAAACIRARMSTMDVAVAEMTATTARAGLGVKCKADTRPMVNRRFAADLERLGYPGGLKKAHEDISDAVALAYVGCARFIEKHA